MASSYYSAGPKPIPTPLITNTYIAATVARMPGGDLAAREPWRAALGYLALDPDAAHAFTYPLFMALLDIDRVSELMRVSAVTRK